MTDEADRKDAETRELREDAKNLLVGGATLGAFSIVTTALVGSTCPMCIVVAPVMLGVGVYKRWRLARVERDRCERDVAAGPAEDEAPGAG